MVFTDVPHGASHATHPPRRAGIRHDVRFLHGSSPEKWWNWVTNTEVSRPQASILELFGACGPVGAKASRGAAAWRSMHASRRHSCALLDQSTERLVSEVGLWLQPFFSWLTGGLLHLSLAACRRSDQVISGRSRGFGPPSPLGFHELDDVHMHSSVIGRTFCASHEMGSANT